MTWRACLLKLWVGLGYGALSWSKQLCTFTCPAPSFYYTYWQWAWLTSEERVTLLWHWRDTHILATEDCNTTDSHPLQFYHCDIGGALRTAGTKIRMGRGFNLESSLGSGFTLYILVIQTLAFNFLKIISNPTKDFPQKSIQLVKESETGSEVSKPTSCSGVGERGGWLVSLKVVGP